MRIYADLGAMFSFSGFVTQPPKRCRTTLKALAAVPRDRLLLESDAPDQCPVLPVVAAAAAEVPGGGSSSGGGGGEGGAACGDGGGATLNEPSFMVLTATAVAAALGCPVHELAAQCARNAARVFRDCLSEPMRSAFA